MVRAHRVATLATFAAVALVVTACGGGSGAGTDPSTATGTVRGTLSVLAFAPGDGATQVALQPTIRVDLDGVIVGACLDDPDTRLLDANGRAVATSRALSAGGRTLSVRPDAPLQPHADYRFELSALTCDNDGRILDRPLRIRFRTEDVTGPTVVAHTPAAGGPLQRGEAIELRFDEVIDPARAASPTVRLEDQSGQPLPVDVAASGDRLTIRPRVDLAGSRAHRVRLDAGAIADRFGNPLAAAWSQTLTTAPDPLPPTLTEIWPSGTAPASPTVAPRVTFDESIDPASVASASLHLDDISGNRVPCTLTFDRDLRAIHLHPTTPLATGARYAVVVEAGVAGVMDRSGNRISTPARSEFVVGADAAAPALRSSHPVAGTKSASLATIPRLEFDEALDPRRLAPDTIEFLVDGVAVACTLDLAPSGAVVKIQPDAPLRPGARATIVIRAGVEGIHDLAGNAFVGERRIDFDVATDPTLPTVELFPGDGHLGLPPGAELTAVFDGPVDPATVDAAHVHVRDELGASVPGDLRVERDNRVLVFAPRDRWVAGTNYVFTIEADGVREPSGNGLATSARSSFRAGALDDGNPPVLYATLNETVAARSAGMTVPPSGFQLQVLGLDAERSFDPGSVRFELQGPPGTPTADELFAAATVNGNRVAYVASPARPFAPGDYALRATATDLSGNQAGSTTMSFRVLDPDSGALPFERVQVVWVRFDLDRDGSGRSDFDEDLLRLGLIAAGDPIGQNRRMAALLRDGVLARVHELVGRDFAGHPLGPDAAPLRVTARRPLGLRHSEIACGGLDPDGEPGRGYGAPSSGTLGRAYFDYRNGNPEDRNTGTGPGLGVFPGELFLFEARVHERAYPAFVTSFAQRFLPIAPDLGGTPAGAHALDAVVLAPGFDLSTASGPQRARYRTVFGAADDWATAIGTILAHEIGHAVGLVAEGPNPRGLHGDQSLHNAKSSAADVMAPAVGFDSLISLTYSFRDLNRAYLRQRLLLK